jgi:murein L,D-transpeptidase YafK
MSGAAFLQFGRSIWVPLYLNASGRKTVEDIIARYGSKVDQRLQPIFQQANIQYPPDKLTFISLKEEKLLEIWAHDRNKWIFITKYPILGASGKAGPKLREGDRQVPEGIYTIAGSNPNSSFHLSLKIDYPSYFDNARAIEDHRTHLGGDIFIHGKSASIGCLAIGDTAIEELFVLAHRVGISRIQVIIAPNDLRTKIAPSISSPSWVADLYNSISAQLNNFNMPTEPNGSGQ